MTLEPDFSLAEKLLKAAQAAGADQADVLMVTGKSLSVSCRMGALEELEHSEGSDIGLRVFVGHKQAIVSSNKPDPATFADLAARAVAMAKAIPDDPYCGLADKNCLAAELPCLDIYDPHPANPEQLQSLALEAETAALAVSGVTNSMGAEAGWGEAVYILANTDGFRGTSNASSWSLAASVLAGQDLNMQRDYEFTTACHNEDLQAAAEIGRTAGVRTVKRLNPKKIASTTIPVVYDPRISSGLLGHFAGAISGAAIARNTSFLKDRMDQQVFAKGLHIIDDPHQKRGLGSSPHDGEGVANAKMTLVRDGVLQSWLLDSRSARQLGLATNGRASRGISGPPTPATTNLYMQNGDQSPADLIAGIDKGVYLTELIGHGVNGLTGDYSRGASGFMIERGEITFPVSEITVAGNLKDMFANITAANDLEFRNSTNAPTLLVEGMTIAGN